MHVDKNAESRVPQGFAALFSVKNGKLILILYSVKKRKGSRYYLCANPNESRGGLIRHLTQEELAELINEDASVMQELTRAGFVMRCEAFGNGERRDFVNPSMV